MSGHKAAYPHRLDDGFLQHPSEKVRERVFGDQWRLDVILIDRNNVPVIVECKQATLRWTISRNYGLHVQVAARDWSRRTRHPGTWGSGKARPCGCRRSGEEPVELVRYDIGIDSALAPGVESWPLPALIPLRLSARLTASH